MMVTKGMDQTEKIALDTISIGAALGSFVDALPAVAALLTIVWTGLRIYETDTVQRLLRKDDKDGEESESE